jgi:predicted transcriptional regulator
MDLNIRNVNPHAIAKIDELAKANNQTRSEYMRETLESLSFLTMRDGIIDRYEKQLQANNILLQETTKSLDDLTSILKELI